MTINMQRKLAALIILVPFAIFIYLLSQPHQVWQNVVFHYYYVAVSSFVAFAVGVFAYLEYRRTNHLKVYLLAAGFIGLAVIYAFHGLITPGKSITDFPSAKQHMNAFVFFGDMSRLWISIFFIPQTFINNKQFKKLNWIPLALIAGMLIASAYILLAFPNSFPDVKYENGQDTYFAIIIKVITMIFLVITVTRYYDGWRVLHNTALMSFIVGGALIAQTPLIFMISKPWGQVWWLAHNIYLLSFTVVGLGLIYSLKYQQVQFFDVFSQVEEFVKTINRQKLEMDQVNQKLILANAELTKFAFTDQLTGAFNRRHFEEISSLEVERSKRYKQKISLLLMDIDHFKMVNDNYGHSVGDKVLIELVRLLQRNIRSSDVLVRWGGEEFLIMAPGLSLEEAGQFAEKIREVTENQCFLDARDLTLSIGVAEFGDSESLDHCIKRADTALYEAKATGRNKVVSST